MSDTKRLLLINNTFETTTLEALKDHTHPDNTLYLPVDFGDLEYSKQQLDTIPAGTYESVGIVVQGNNMSSWGLALVDAEFASKLKTICVVPVDTTQKVQIDIFAWSMNYSDLVLRAFSANLGKGVCVNFTSGNTAGAWNLEHSISGGFMVKKVQTPRALDELYMTNLTNAITFKF